MDNIKKNIINIIAQETHNVFEIETPIKNMDDVIKVLGGSIQEVKEFNKMGVMKKGNSFVLFLHAFSNEKRRRFIIAQQLGHLFLHMGMIDNERWSKQDENVLFEPADIEQVRQANEFALAFLMPKEAYIRVMNENTENGHLVRTSKIAEYFGVTISDASLRGQSLGELW